MMSKLRFGSVIALLAGLYIIVTNFLETTERKQIDREGIHTVGISTLKIEHRGRRGARYYELEVLYPVEAAVIHSTRVVVSRELYVKTRPRSALIIKYLEDDPSKLIIVGESLASPEKYAVGVAVLVLGAAGTWWFFIRNRAVAPPRRPPDRPRISSYE